MSTAVPLAVLVAIAAGASVYLFIATRRRMQPYWERSCTGRAWLNEFPMAQSEDIRTFLSLFVSSFGFPRTRALQFAPNDQPLEIYRALNPLKGMPDALELEKTTIVGGVRERLERPRRGRGRKCAPTALDPALLRGPST